VRADFYPDLMASPLWREIQNNRVEVTPLGEEGLRKAITEPAAHVGVAIAGELVERLGHDAPGQPGGLPPVQGTPARPWRRREGGVGGALPAAARLRDAVGR